jgi:hypothetical protein
MLKELNEDNEDRLKMNKKKVKDIKKEDVHDMLYNEI